MSILEQKVLDMAELMNQSFEIADMINRSQEVADYLYWKQQKEQDEQVQQLVKQLLLKKDLFEECQRFGHFHPDYHAALAAVQAIQEKLDEISTVQQFKQAEERLDDLLFEVSQTIAYAVSASIKVPSNKPVVGGGCSTGSCSDGGCSGNCG